MGQIDRSTVRLLGCSLATIGLAFFAAFAVMQSDAAAPQSAPQGVNLFSAGPTDIDSNSLIVIGDTFYTRSGFGVESVVAFELFVEGGDIEEVCVFTLAYPGSERWSPLMCDADFETANRNLLHATTSNGYALSPHLVTTGGFAQAAVAVNYYAFQFRAMGTNGAMATVRGTLTPR